MQAVIVPRFLGPSYFVLEGQDNGWGIDNAKRSHIPMRPHFGRHAQLLKTLCLEMSSLHWVIVLPMAGWGR
jgi:hypothetical protein